MSLEVSEGEVVGIIGRNGAGKSTLLKILSRVTAPTEGCINVKGRIASLLEVGTGFHPELTGRENIFLNGAILGMRKAEIRAKFDEILAFAEVEKFIDTPVKRYSSGMYVRLAFAVAAHLDPEILIVDEVLAVGDVAFQKKCLGKMSAIANEGRTVLFVSHNMGAIQNLCGRAVLLHGGRALNAGVPSVIIPQYGALSGKESETPIRDRLDREGSGGLVVTDVRLSVPGAEGIDVLHCGDRVDIGISYTTHSLIQKPIFYIGIYDNFQGQLLHLNTRVVAATVPAVDRPGSIVCTIHQLPLSPGRYSVTTAVESGGVVLDKLRNAKSFTVERGDFYGTGDTSSLTWGKFLVEHTWQHQA
ncbi:ABC transporter ATP-binding protein [Verrucomicrobiota bacterium]